MRVLYCRSRSGVRPTHQSPLNLITTLAPWNLITSNNPFIPLIRCTFLLKERSNEGVVREGRNLQVEWLFPPSSANIAKLRAKKNTEANELSVFLSEFCCRVGKVFFLHAHPPRRWATKTRCPPYIKLYLLVSLKYGNEFVWTNL